jgi:hypothetical protein
MNRFMWDHTRMIYFTFSNKADSSRFFYGLTLIRWLCYHSQSGAYRNNSMRAFFYSLGGT